MGEVGRMQSKVPQKRVMEMYNLSRSGLYTISKKLGLKTCKLGTKVFYDILELEQAMEVVD